MLKIDISDIFHSKADVCVCTHVHVFMYICIYVSSIGLESIYEDVKCIMVKRIGRR